jgi:hypothetical protein
MTTPVQVRVEAPTVVDDKALNLLPADGQGELFRAAFRELFDTRNLVFDKTL